MELQVLQESDVASISDIATDEPVETTPESFPSDHDDAASPVVVEHDYHHPVNLEHVPPKFPSKWRTLWPLCIFFVLITSFAVFVHWYLYTVLVSDHPKLGRLYMSQSRTLLGVMVLTTALSLLLSMLFKEVLDSFRWHMLTRKEGTTSLTFLALSTSTSLYGLFVLSFFWGAHTVWTLHKLMLPMIIWFLNFVPSARITFTHDYVDQNTAKVFAGIAPMNASLLNDNHITVAVLGTYFIAWLPSIAGVTKFATRVDPLFCRGLDCEAILLPGGVEQVRMFKKTLNETMLNTNKYVNNEALVTHDSPAIHLEFSPLSSGYRFNRTNECLLTGQHNDQGIFTCVGYHEGAILAGMTSCPSIQRTEKTCFTDTAWTSRLQTNISMLAFRRIATTVYDRNNLSIISVSKISPITNKSIELYNPADFRYIFDKLFRTTLPALNTTADQRSQIADDTTMTDATSASITWAMSLSSEVFNDDKSSAKDILKGMFIIPIHFTSSATMLANATAEKLLGSLARGFDLPDSLIGTASGAKIVPRLRGDAWTVWCFIAISTAVLLYSLLLFGMIWVRKARLPESSAFGDVDLAQRAAAGFDDERSLPGYLKSHHVRDGNTISIASTLKGTRLLQLNHNGNDRNRIVVEVGT